MEPSPKITGSEEFKTKSLTFRFRGERSTNELPHGEQTKESTQTHIQYNNIQYTTRSRFREVNNDHSINSTRFPAIKKSKLQETAAKVKCIASNPVPLNNWLLDKEYLEGS